jgi:hypothetical protein
MHSASLTLAPASGYESQARQAYAREIKAIAGRYSDGSEIPFVRPFIIGCINISTFNAQESE